jgi:hypothetical protein
VWSLSAGRGTRSLDPQYINQDLKTPFADVTSYDTGATYTFGFGAAELSTRASVFQTKVDKDLFFNQTEGRNTLAGGTTRNGLSLFSRILGPFYDVAFNATWVKATFDDTKLVIPYAPPFVMRVDGALFGDLPWRVAGRSFSASLGAGLSYVGPRPLPFNEHSADQILADLAANVAYKPVTFGLTVTNLLDRKYRLSEYNYVSDFRSQDYPTLVPARHFVAGEPRAIFATLAFTFETSEGSHGKTDGQ